jgi:hypothetical protein
MMLETIVAGVLTRAAYDAIKEFSLLSFDDIKERVRNFRHSENQIENPPPLTDQEVSNIDHALTDDVFLASVNDFLIKKNLRPLDLYLSASNLSENECEELRKMVYFLSSLFDKFIFTESKDKLNLDFIKYSTEELIPEKIRFASSRMSYKESETNDDELLLFQLRALLDHIRATFESEKVLYGSQGVDPRLIAEMTRLEFEMNKIQKKAHS